MGQVIAPPAGCAYPNASHLLNWGACVERFVRHEFTAAREPFRPNSAHGLNSGEVALMKGMLGIIGFTALTALAWGVYGPVLHSGQEAMRGYPLGVGLRAFVGVGLAYFVIAIVVPLIWLEKTGEAGGWNKTGVWWSLIAGGLGALGALGIILALGFQGKPIYVMPIVFGGAPVVNTFTTMCLSKTFKQAGPVFYAGLILVIFGAITVLVTRPQPKSHGASQATASASGEAHSADTESAKASAAGEAASASSQSATGDSSKTSGGSGRLAKWRDMLLVVLFILMTAVCWGAYGPLLHKGQMAMGGSRLRPLLCVGIAYLVVAVAMPVALLYYGAKPNYYGEFTPLGLIWSMTAGAAGAVGALGLILAFSAGGKPIYVMPLVFGVAPVVNTIVSLLKTGQLRDVSTFFSAGLLLVIAGAVTVLVFSPKGHAPPKAAPTRAPEPAKV